MKESIIRLCLFGFMLVLAMSSSAQIFRGDKFFEKHDYERALVAYEKAYVDNFSNSYLTRKIANSYRSLGNVKTSLVWYKRTLEMDQSNQDDMLYYAQALKTVGAYDESQRWYIYYNKMRPDDSRASSHLRDQKYYLSLKRDSAKYNIVKLEMNTDLPEFGISMYGDKILFSAAGVKNPGATQDHDRIFENPYMDVYQGTIDELGQLQDVERMSSNVNSKFHDGPVWFDSMNKELFITRNNEKKGKPVLDAQGRVNLKIYRSVQEDGKWMKPEELSLNSNEYSNAHPTLSPDGNTLYFSSNRPGGTGGNDIYSCKRIGGDWSSPVNMGRPVNSEGDEMFPTVGKDGTLFFASDGHVGLGALDVFSSEKNEDGDWMLPVNLGYPINSREDDFGIIQVDDNKIGYFSSNRGSDGIQDDIYRFVVRNNIRIRASIKEKTALYGIDGVLLRIYNEEGVFVGTFNDDGEGTSFADMERKYGNYKVMIEGDDWATDSIMFSIDENAGDEIVLEAIEVEKKSLAKLPVTSHTFSAKTLDYTSNEVLTDFSVTIFNATTGESIHNLKTDEEGEIQFPFEPGKNYRIEFDKEGYSSKSISVTGPDTEGIVDLNNLHNLKFTKIAVGQALNFENIYYDFDKYEIRNDAKAELDKVVNILKENPNMNLSINSHTDSRGASDYNKWLSQERANSVVKYLTNSGVDASRVVAVGHGESSLVNDCDGSYNCSTKNHQDNRRSEFIITGI